MPCYKIFCVIYDLLVGRKSSKELVLYIYIITKPTFNKFYFACLGTHRVSAPGTTGSHETKSSVIRSFLAQLRDAHKWSVIICTKINIWALLTLHVPGMYMIQWTDFGFHVNLAKDHVFMIQWTDQILNLFLSYHSSTVYFVQINNETAQYNRNDPERKFYFTFQILRLTFIGVWSQLVVAKILQYTIMDFSAAVHAVVCTRNLMPWIYNQPV